MSSTSWPPENLRPILDRQAVWSAWYSGEPDELAAAYGGSGGHAAGFSDNHNQRGRVANAVYRWFWGTTTPAEQRPARLHIPLASDIAGVGASLLFSSPPRLTTGHAATDERLQGYIDDAMLASLREAAELGGALGGVFLRTVWDEDVADRPWLAPVHADAAIPEWSYDRLRAVTFHRIVEEDGGVVFRHLERHEKGFIRHSLHRGSRDELGHTVPLTEVEDTRPLADVLTDGDHVALGEHVPLTAAYIPNMRPNRVWRHLPQAANLGRADIAGSEGQLDALDETWSSWMRDIRLGKARLVVPQSYLRSQGRGQGAAFNPEQELFSPLNIPVDEKGSAQIDQVQFKIRYAEHQATAQDLTKQIVRSSGYSLESLAMDGEGGPATATEINSRKERSLSTRGDKILYWRPAIAQLSEALLHLDIEVFGAEGLEPQRPQVMFPDATTRDTKQIAETIALMADARMASRDTLVRMFQGPNASESDIQTELELLAKEDAEQARAGDEWARLMIAGDHLNAERNGTQTSRTPVAVGRSPSGRAPDTTQRTPREGTS